MRAPAGQHRFGELEHVVARHVQHGGLNLTGRQLARRVQQGELLQLLMRSQQIALDAVGEEGERPLPVLARSHALPLRRKALGDPARQRGALHWVDLHRDARAFQRREPGRRFRLPVQPRQQHQRQHVGVLGGRFRQPLQGSAAVLARLARRDADFD